MNLRIETSLYNGGRRRPQVWGLTNVWISLQLGIALAGPAHAVQNRERLDHIALASMPARSDADVLIPQVRGLYDGLEEAGYTEGKNLIIHKIHNTNENEARAALKELLGHPIKAIVATSATETAIAKQLSSTIPIIFAPARDPIRLGFIQSYARPGGNLTGLSYSRNFDDSAKQLAVFRQTLPMMNRVTVLYSPRTTATDALDAVKGVAGHLKVKLAVIPVMSQLDAVNAVTAGSKNVTDGIFLICSAAFRDLKPLTKITLTKRLPVFGCTGQQVADEGALMTYTPDIYFIGYRGSWYVDRVLKGAKPQDLPVEVPDRFETVINLTTAKTLGVNIPPERLILADRVFK